MSKQARLGVNQALRLLEDLDHECPHDCPVHALLIGVARMLTKYSRRLKSQLWTQEFDTD